MVVKRLIDRASDTVDNVKFKTESMYRSTVDSVEDVVDYTSAAFLKAYAGVVGTYHALKYAGLTIALITAPVPTLVAMAILWLMELSIDSVKSNIEHELDDNKKKREFDRVVGILKKYGKIPQTAVVNTEFVEMEIDSVSGSVSGVILQGEYQGISLNEVDDEVLAKLTETSPNKETKSLLEAYSSYRKKARS